MIGIIKKSISVIMAATTVCIALTGGMLRADIEQPEVTLPTLEEV